jgi:hypothetical protein
MKRRRCIPIIIASIFITILLSVHHDKCSAAGDEIYATTWMSWDRESRSMYIIGFFGGYSKALKTLGGDLRAKERITWEDISDDIYRAVRSDSSLRRYQMGTIIQTYMLIYFTVTDRDGVPIK